MGVEAGHNPLVLDDGMAVGAAAVPLDRAAVMVLQQLAEAEPVRSGKLAAHLKVEAPHVTRQVQRLQQVGYVGRVPDPPIDHSFKAVQFTGMISGSFDRHRTNQADPGAARRPGGAALKQVCAAPKQTHAAP